jgi:hypothetical protein
LRPGIAPQSVTVFHDDDHRAFFHWLDQNNEDGYFLNTRPNPTTTVPMLHRARCEHIGPNRDTITFADQQPRPSLNG